MSLSHDLHQYYIPCAGRKGKQIQAANILCVPPLVSSTQNPRIIYIIPLHNFVEFKKRKHNFNSRSNSALISIELQAWRNRWWWWVWTIASTATTLWSGLCNTSFLRRRRTPFSSLWSCTPSPRLRSPSASPAPVCPPLRLIIWIDYSLVCKLNAVLVCYKNCLFWCWCCCWMLILHFLRETMLYLANFLRN